MIGAAANLVGVAVSVLFIAMMMFMPTVLAVPPLCGAGCRHSHEADVARNHIQAILAALWPEQYRPQTSFPLPIPDPRKKVYASQHARLFAKGHPSRVHHLIGSNLRFASWHMAHSLLHLQAL
jgi:hypothetical protein